MNHGSFNKEEVDFLAKLCEMSNCNTKKSIDAFQVGAKLNLEEEKTERIVNYGLAKGWIKEPDRTFDRINDGNPPPSQKFHFIFITFEGIDRQYKEEHESTSTPASHVNIGDVYNFGDVKDSAFQIRTQESTQNVVFSKGQIEELKRIIAQIEQITKDKANEIPPNNRSEIESDVRDIHQELVKPDGDNRKLLNKIRSLGIKIKDLTPFLGLATQLAILLSAFAN